MLHTNAASRPGHRRRPPASPAAWRPPHGVRPRAVLPCV